MNREKLQQIIDAGDTEGCVALFARTSEADRKAIAGYVVERLKLEAKTPLLETRAGQYSYNPRLAVLELAAIAACSLSQLKQAGQKAQSADPEVYTVLAARRPAWIDQWAEMMLASNVNFWPLIRQLVREGICQPPQTNNYVLGMIYGVLDRNRFRKNRQSTSLAKALLEDPELLKQDIWRLFEVDGQGETSLAAHDKFGRPNQCWNEALCELSKTGKLSRERLLDSALTALVRDFGSFRSGWYSRFHDLLQPSLAEQMERTDSYLALLASAIPTTVSWVLKLIDRIDKQQPLAAARLADCLVPVLAARAKGTVIAALKILDRIARRESAARPHIARIAIEALANETSAVQELAMALIEKYGDASDVALCEAVFRYRDALAPSVRPRLERWQSAPAATKPPRVTDAPPAAKSTKRPRESTTLDARLADLAGVSHARMCLDRGVLEIRDIEFDGTEIPRLDRATALRPVANLDELVELSSAVIEGNGGIDDVERVLDGISRLCGERPADFDTRTHWLAKRAVKFSERLTAPFIGESVESDLLATLQAWLTGRLEAPGVQFLRQGAPTSDVEEFKAAIKRPQKTNSHLYDYEVEGESVRFWHLQARATLGLFSRRAYEIAARAVAHKPRLLLSASTHAGGWIDPRVLVKRARQLSQTGEDSTMLDKILSLLRLAPDGRAEALCQANSLPGEFGQALRHALGADRIKIGPTAGLWVAAARSRSPWSDDPAVDKAHPKLGPDAGQAAAYRFVVSFDQEWDPLKVATEPPAPVKIAPDLVTVQLHEHLYRSTEVECSTVVSIEWRQSLWPVAREAFFSAGATALASNLDWDEARWMNRTFLQPLLDPDTPLKPMAQLLLAAGLAAKEPGEQGLAAEALIAAIQDGRLDGSMLGQMMATLWPTGLVKMARWAKALADVARISPLHAQVVLEALERSLQGDAEEFPRDGHALLELYKELTIDAGTSVRAEATRQLLEQLQGAGKTGKAAGQLLACKDEPGGKRIAAVMQIVLDQAVRRAERWTSRTRAIAQ